MNTTYRTQLHEAYTFVRSTEASRAVSPITLNHLIYKQMEFLKGSPRPLIDAMGADTQSGRVSRYETIKAIKANIDKIIADIKKEGDSAEEQGLTEPTESESNQFPTLQLPSSP